MYLRTPEIGSSLHLHFEERLRPTKHQSSLRLRQGEEFLWSHLQFFSERDVLTTSNLGEALKSREVESANDLHLLWQHALLSQAIPRTYSEKNPILTFVPGAEKGYARSKSESAARQKVTGCRHSPVEKGCSWFTALTSIIQVIRSWSSKCAPASSATAPNLLASPNQS